MSIPSLRGMFGLDSCLQPWYTELIWHIGKRFLKIYLHRVNRPAAFFGNSWGLASAQCEPVSLNSGRPADRANQLERNTQNLAIPTPRFARMFSTWNPPSHAEGAYPQNCMVEQPRNQV